MDAIKEKYIFEYLEKIKRASSELAKKESFKTLLNRLFSDDINLISIIDAMDLGAEKTVFSIPLEHRLKTGNADTQYRNIIIEFEKDLVRTGNHAQEQLIEYFAGNLKSGSDFDFVLIATDCISWKVYYPFYDNLISKEEILLTDIVLKEKDSFSLTEKNSEDFFYFIDHYLFRTQNQKPTFQNIKHDFGESSHVFLSSMHQLSLYFNKIIKDDTELQTAIDQWNLFLSIAYGSFKGSEKVFLIHTYLSVFSKIIAYAVVSKQRFINDSDMLEILNGKIFENLNLNNFIESDFYFWVAKEKHFKSLKKVFRIIAAQLSDYDFTRVDEDILKGVYQELIDIETRHTLGEYYTPDWLADKIVMELKPQRESTFLDPSCGSGTFLRAVISRMKTDFPDLSVEDLLSQVVGIDIHPLSVLIAKTTILLAVADKLKKLRKSVHIQVYLANTLHVPEDSLGLFSDFFDVQINKNKYQVPSQITENPSFFDDAISFCDEFARQDAGANESSLEDFGKALTAKFTGRKYIINSEIISSLFSIYAALKNAIEQKKDSIWSFILQNSYKPLFLKENFDFVVGNPPWIVFRDMNNEKYQKQLKDLALKYKLVPRVENITHLELAAIFLSHCSVSFLKEGGEICFVLPRGFLSADHHENTRNGSAVGFRISEIWDLIDTKPLFRITACVIRANKFISKKEVAKTELLYKDREIKGYVVVGNLPVYQANWSIALNKLSFKKVDWFYARLGKRTAFSQNNIQYAQDKSYYLPNFKQGATIVPRNLYFVSLQNWDTVDIGQSDLSLDAKNTNENYDSIVAETDKEIKKDAKMPWADITLKMKINGKFLFRTALAKNLLPFCLINPTLVHLPINVDDQKKIALLSWKEIRGYGYLESSKWFKAVEEQWDKYKTEKSKDISYLQWLNWQNKLTEQNLNQKYLVLYTASAKDASAVVVNREEINLPFIVESKAYWYGTNNKNEAFYLSAFLNSNFANKEIKDFQSTGLFGQRDIHKKILELPLPKFDEKDRNHKELAKIGANCTKKSTQFVDEIAEIDKVTGVKLGTVRKAIRDSLKDELLKIDQLLAEII